MRISDWSSDVCSSDLCSSPSCILPRACCPELDLLFVRRTADDTLHVNAGNVDAVGVEAARGDDFLHFHHRDLACRGGGRIEIARRLAEDEIARLVRFPGLHNREIGHDAAFRSEEHTSE